MSTHTCMVAPVATLPPQSYPFEASSNLSPIFRHTMLFLSHPEPGTFFGKVLGVLSSVIGIPFYPEGRGAPALLMFVPIQVFTGRISRRFNIVYLPSAMLETRVVRIREEYLQTLYLRHLSYISQLRLPPWRLLPSVPNLGTSRPKYLLDYDMYL
jgi:hypothetical protein